MGVYDLTNTLEMAKTELLNTDETDNQCNKVQWKAGFIPGPIAGIGMLFGLLVNISWTNLTL